MRKVCELGPRRGQGWTPLRGATRLAASLHPTRQERGATNTHRRARQRRETLRATDAKKRWGEGGGPGNVALPAENGEVFANQPNNAGNSGRRGTAQQRGPRVCTPRDRSETREQREVARNTAKSHCRAQHRPAPPRSTDAEQTWGKGNRPHNESFPAEDQDNYLRIRPAARATLDAATRPNNPGRIFAPRKTGARRARNAMLQCALKTTT